MKLVAAPDSFKESLSAETAAQIICNAAKNKGWDALPLPVSDGGEGFTDALVHNAGGQRIKIDTFNPLMRPITAEIALLADKTAVVEIAAASGLCLVERDNRTPMNTTTFGTGVLIRRAMEIGAKRLIVGLGGSATNDCGAGIMQALGFVLYDEHGKALPNGTTGKDLLSVRDIKAPETQPFLPTVLACDVANPLLGANGATTIFAPQKGATAAEVKQLEQGTANFVRVLEKMRGTDLKSRAGSGAAGGAGVPLTAFFNARTQSGIDIVLDVSDFENRIADADMIVTGEGRIDAQTVCGKAVAGVAKRSKNIRVVAVCGCLGAGWEALRQTGVTEIHPITPQGIPFETAVKNAGAYLRETTLKILG